MRPLKHPLMCVYIKNIKDAVASFLLFTWFIFFHYVNAVDTMKIDTYKYTVASLLLFPMMHVDVIMNREQPMDLNLHVDTFDMRFIQFGKCTMETERDACQYSACLSQ